MEHPITSAEVKEEDKCSIKKGHRARTSGQLKLLETQCQIKWSFLVLPPPLVPSGEAKGFTLEVKKHNKTPKSLNFTIGTLMQCILSLKQAEARRR